MTGSPAMILCIEVCLLDMMHIIIFQTQYKIVDELCKDSFIDANGKMD